MPSLRRRRASVDERCDLLIVCTGNFSRSPYLAALLSDRLPHLDVRSAGTAPAPPDLVNPLLPPLLAARGVTAAPTPPRKLTAGLVRGATLVIGAAHEHRLTAVRLDRGAATRAVTAKELARYLAPAPAPRGLAAVVERVAAAIAAPDPDDHDDDLPDPIEGGPPAHEAMAAAIDPIVEVLVRSLAP